MKADTSKSSRLVYFVVALLVACVIFLGYESYLLERRLAEVGAESAANAKALENLRKSLGGLAGTVNKNAEAANRNLEESQGFHRAR